MERTLRQSFLISADMAHALHPNYTDKHDSLMAPAFQGGLVLKHNNNQRYATNAISAALFRWGVLIRTRYKQTRTGNTCRHGTCAERVMVNPPVRCVTGCLVGQDWTSIGSELQAGRQAGRAVCQVRARHACTSMRARCRKRLGTAFSRLNIVALWCGVRWCAVVCWG